MTEREINDIVENNTGLVYKQLTKFNFCDNADAISLGMEALWKAACDYDTSRGFKFSTLASVYIFNAIASHARKATNKRQLHVISYNRTVSNISGEDVELVNFMDSGVDIEKDYVAAELSQLVRATFKQQYHLLSNATHKRIIRLWYKSGFKATTVDIASAAGVSQSYVSRTLSNFRATLRNILKEHYYE